MRVSLILFLLIPGHIFAQLIQNIEFEAVGKPTWHTLVPMGEHGTLFFIKTDQTKAKVLFFDKNLKKNWEKDIFLDVERSPTAYTFDANTATFLFRETSGMFYQVFIFNLADGTFKTEGFELREYFDDQDFVIYDNKIILAGATENHAAFYIYDFKSEEGKLLKTAIEGKVKLQEIVPEPESGGFNTLWLVKTMGYSNEKRKKGAFIKSTRLALAAFDSSAILINQKSLEQKAGNFPVTGQLIFRENQIVGISGQYQNISGDKGLFYSKFPVEKPGNDMHFYSFKELLKGQPEFQKKDLESIIKDYGFLPHQTISSENGFSLGGVFFKIETKNVTQQINNDNGFSRNNSGFGRNNTRTQSRSVFAGYHYLSGILANIDSEGNLLNQSRFDLNQINPQLKQSLSFNTKGSVAYCLKGNLSASNLNIGTKPIIYKLSDEQPNAKNRPFLPSYNEVRHWYNEYFIADGSKSRIEVLQMKPNENQTSEKKKKKKAAPTFTQIRKTIYLTKIASGQ
jgi:hypothetical protein